MKDFRQESPKANFDALIFRYGGDNPKDFYSMKINSKNISNTLGKIQGHWREVYGDKPFNYFFLDDHYNEQYKSEVRFGSIFGIFSGLAIFVACLGLFGLASFITSLRMKEVGIRKVLGASFGQLWLLLTKDFVKLVTMAIIISIIPAWYLMGNWLSNFANRISLSWWLFVLPSLGLLLIAVLTISYHTLSTVSTNPAETLQDE